jgi:hypothetical protein
MSGWHGGKGSDSRVTNHKAYWDSPLWKKSNNADATVDHLVYNDPIEKITNTTKSRKYLFLDDYRIPSDAYLWDERMTLECGAGINRSKWTTVQSYQEFVDHIEQYGIPDVISFDNDLELNHYSEKVSLDQKNSGIHCALYLVDKCKELGLDIPDYYVHSANAEARSLIRQILN